MEDGDIEIRGTGRVDEYVRMVLRPAEYIDEFKRDGGTPREVAYLRALHAEPLEEVGEGMLATREELRIEGRTTETFRQVDIDHAIEMLSPNPAVDPLDQFG